MKKKLLVCIITIIFLTACHEDIKTLKELNYFKDVPLKDVTKVKIIKFTEAGSDIKEETNSDEIKKIYNMVNNIKVGKETDMACEDNTTIYAFYIDNEEKISVEIECDWVILNGKRYLIK